MNLKDLLLPSFAQMLEALAGQLDKAKESVEAEGDSIETLLAARLSPDMAPLSTQVHFACLQAEEVRARLLDEEIDTVAPPQSFREAKDLISRTVDRLRSADAGDENIGPERTVTLDLPTGMIFDMDLFEYARSWSIPQFYFHLITAYAIMRHHGVDLGKADYVPHMFQFLRNEAV